MTAKEKAKELVDKYFLEIEGADTYAFNLPSMNLYIAKKCALIAVEQMMEVYVTALYSAGIDKEIAESSTSPYLNEVKEEIINL